MHFMDRAISVIISHIKREAIIVDKDIEKYIRLSSNDMDHYLFITKVIQSDLLNLIKDRLTFGIVVLYAPINEEQYDKYFEIVLNLISVLFDVLLSIEKEFIGSYRMRQIIVNLKIMHILNSLIEISSTGCNILASHTIHYISDILPCINTIESERFFNSKCIGLRTKHIIKACKIYLKDTIIQMKKDQFVLEWNNDNTNLNQVGLGVVTMCTYLLSFTKHRKNIFKKKIHRKILLIFFQILKIFDGILLEKFGKVWDENYLNHLVEDENIEEIRKICDDLLLNTKPLNYLYPILRRCLEFVYILKDYFDVTSIIYFNSDNPQQTEHDFECYWNNIGKRCFAFLWILTADIKMNYWYSMTDKVVNKHNSDRKSFQDEFPHDMIPKIVTEIENDEYFISDKCMYWKCSKSSKEIKLKKCCMCLSAFYCGKKCQKRDWFNHKQYCRQW